MLVYGGIYVKRIELEHSLKLLDTRWNSLNLGRRVHLAHTLEMKLIIRYCSSHLALKELRLGRQLKCRSIEPFPSRHPFLAYHLRP